MTISDLTGYGLMLSHAGRDPKPSEGRPGELFLNYSSMAIFRKTLNRGWERVASLEGRQGLPGPSVTSAAISGDNHLLLGMSNGVTIDAGFLNIPTSPDDDGGGGGGGVGPVTPHSHQMSDVTGLDSALAAKESIGEFPSIGVNTASYTLALSDKGRVVEMNLDTANTVTVPPNSSVAFPIRSRIYVTQTGTGQTEIVAGPGVTIRHARGLRHLAGQWAGAELYKRGTDEWVIPFGELSEGTDPAAGGGLFFIGVNIQGMEGGARELSRDDVVGTDYTMPSQADINYLSARGVTVIRLPICWERAQHTLNGALNTTYINEILAILGYCAAATPSPVKAIIDLHAYTEYWANTTTKYLMAATGNLTPAHLADFWTRLVTVVKNHAGVWGYDIMNEPQALVPHTTLLPTIMTAAYNAITALDKTHWILVEGNNFSGAHEWQDQNPNFPISDPHDLIIYSAHQYVDQDHNGNTTQHPTWAGIAGSGRTLANVLSDAQHFINWCNQHGVRGNVGETGIYTDGLDISWELIKLYKAANISVTPWHFGPNFGADAFALYPYNALEQPGWGVIRTEGVPATTVALTGPDRAVAGVASTNFTVRYTGRLTSLVTITPASSGAGTFSPASITLAANTWNPSATFTYTNPSQQIVNISVSASVSGWTSPPVIEFSTDPTIAGGQDNLILTQNFNNPSWQKNGTAVVTPYVDPADGQTYTRLQMSGDYNNNIRYPIGTHGAGQKRIRIKSLNSNNQYVGLYGGVDNDVNIDGTYPKQTWFERVVTLNANLPFLLHARGTPVDILIQEAKATVGAMTAYVTVPQSGAAPRVIFSTDPGQDVDDAEALSRLIYLHRAGSINLIGVVATTNNDRAGSFCRLMLDHLGLPSVPVATYKGSSLAQTDHFVASLTNFFGYTAGRSSFPDPVPSMRQWLKDSPDASVRIVAVGPLSDIYDLLTSAADGIDARDGTTLITAKVARAYFMGGFFDPAQNVTTSGSEYNWSFESSKVASVHGSWPTDIWMADFNLGEATFIGPLSVAQGNTWVLKKAYELYQVSNPASIQTFDSRINRAAFDGITVDLLLGVADRYTMHRGTVTMSGNVPTFTKNGTGKNYYAESLKTAAQRRTYLNVAIDATDEPTLVLAAPTLQTVVQGTGTDLIVTHSAVLKATGYQYSLDSGAWVNLAANKTIVGLTASTTYSVRVRALRYATGGAASNAVSATTAAVGNFDPINVSQVARHFDFADAAAQTISSGRVTAVADRNGVSAMYTDHGPRAITTSHFGSNRRAVEFANGDVFGGGVAGTYGRLWVDLNEMAGATDYSIFTTFSLEDDRGDNGRIISVSGSTGEDYAGNGNFILDVQPNTTIIRLFAVSASTGIDIGQNVPKLIEIRVRSNSAQLYVNGVLSGTARPIGAALRTSPTLVMCRRSDADANLIFGQARALMVLNGVPSTSDQAKIEGYLAWHATGDGSLLPTGHAYKSAPPS